MTDLSEATLNSKILLVGAGGIGCEVLKNLVLAGFNNIVVIDLDTIDVSNLNRQFLFQKQHVGKSKALIARESVIRLNPTAKIVALHDSILNAEYDLNYYGQFSVVANALDNKLARSHVNRMCLAADIPLIESGTAGYLGQATLIKKGLTECYECVPKPRQKVYPSCTIRNTPSEPIHCVVWSKHLFNQIFGELDIDDDVSPDQADPNNTNGTGEPIEENESDIKRLSTRAWALECDYNSHKLFDKLFNQDINYLIKMTALWKERTSPIPLDRNHLPDEVAGPSIREKWNIKEQRIWSVKECAEVFDASLKKLRSKALQLSEGDYLVWDKDDNDSMDFVAACTNIRAVCFNIPQLSKFEIKSMAGNIIPAIATTNAIISGVIVFHLIKVLKGEFEKIKGVFLNKKPNPKKKLLVPCVIDLPNPNCYACAPRSVINLHLNLEKTLIKTFEEKILKKELNMIGPDVGIEGKNVIVLSSEREETEDNLEKPLSTFITNGSCLRCDDFLQNFTIFINVYHKDKLKDDLEYEIVGEIPEPVEEETAQETISLKRKLPEDSDGSPSKKKICMDEQAKIQANEDDLILMD